MRRLWEGGAALSKLVCPAFNGPQCSFLVLQTLEAIRTNYGLSASPLIPSNLVPYYTLAQPGAVVVAWDQEWSSRAVASLHVDQFVGIRLSTGDRLSVQVFGETHL